MTEATSSARVREAMEAARAERAAAFAQLLAKFSLPIPGRSSVAPQLGKA